MSELKQIEWTGLYNESWQGEITPEAFSHPAKFSRGLIRQIYKFMLDEGMLAAGDRVVVTEELRNEIINKCDRVGINKIKL
jgi:hypothetical protein